MRLLSVTTGVSSFGSVAFFKYLYFVKTFQWCTASLRLTTTTRPSLSNALLYIVVLVFFFKVKDFVLSLTSHTHSDSSQSTQQLFWSETDIPFFFLLCHLLDRWSPIFLLTKNGSAFCSLKRLNLLGSAFNPSFLLCPVAGIIPPVNFLFRNSA